MYTQYVSENSCPTSQISQFASIRETSLYMLFNITIETYCQNRTESVITTYVGKMWEPKFQHDGEHSNH